MAQRQLNLVYALRHGEIVSIADVESGLKCECACPACGELLVAKKGQKMMHHFAHHSGSTCEYGYESSLHLAAKDILSKTKRILLPPVYLNFSGSYKEKELISEAKEIDIEGVDLEKRYNDIIPDVVVYAGGKKFFIEIYVTHPIDDKKLEKIRVANISTIEIDLSKKDKMMTVQELTEILLNNSDEKKWKYNALEEKYLQKFYKVADKRKIVSRGFTLHVDCCPIKSRIWRGKPYANFIDDCIYCKYCISAEGQDEILCSGRQRIARLCDFDISEADRVKSSDDEIDKNKGELFNSGYCPNCGGKLVERESQYGAFWGCSNYPHCRFMAYPDKNTGEIKMKS